MKVSHNKVSPMKNTIKRRHSESYETGLKRSQERKQLTNERQQHRRNKRLKMALGA